MGRNLGQERMDHRPTILITNDDGIEAPGLYHLWRALVDVADVFIVAPAFEQSGVGCKITLHKPLQIRKTIWEKETPAWKINGTPADCVRLGSRVILGKEPDLIVSGINRGANSGRVVLHSGTIGGVIAGAFRGIQGIAFSCVSFESPNYLLAEKCVLPLVRHILAHPLPKGSFLNVNIPDAFDEIRGFRLARQGMSYWAENPEQREHPDGGFYYWQGGAWCNLDEHEESDVALLKQGFVTAVPIHVQELTDHTVLKERKEMFEASLNFGGDLDPTSAAPPLEPVP